MTCPATRIDLGRWVGWPVLLGMLAAVGCGPSFGKVSGKVYYKTELVKGGTVSFVSPDNKVSRMAEIQEDGSYTVDKVPLGDVTICVDTSSYQPPSANARQYAPPPDAPGGYKPPDRAARAKRYTWIPQRYTTPEKSSAKYTVQAGSQEYEIKLVD